MHKLLAKTAAGALAVLVLVALAATPAQSKPTSVAGNLTTVATNSAIIDPVTGQEILVALQFEAAAAASMAAAAPDEGCRTVVSYYIIYFSVPYYRELLRWRFRHSWCWEIRRVYWIDTDEERVAKDPTIKMEGTWSPFIGPVGANTVRTKFEGMHFEYCPLIGAGVACFGNFDPIIDVYLSWRGAYTDRTQLA